MKSSRRTVYGRFALISVCAFTVFLALPHVTFAAYKIEQIDISNSSAKDFVVGPGKIELEVLPGEGKTTLITVTNRMGSTRNFSLGVEDFTGSKNPSEVVVLLGDERGPYSLKDFLHFEKETFELKNGERATIPVRVTLPADAQPGGLYGSILVSTTAKDSTIVERSAIVSRVGVLFFVKVPGSVQETGSLKSFKTINDKIIFQGGPINLQLLFENTGSVYLNPYGEIRIKNITGEEVGVVEVEPWFAMPQSLRLREVSWDRPMLLGRYTATATINRGYGDIVDTQTLSFWVIPWKILVGALVAIFLLVFVIRFMFGRFEIKRKR